MALKPIHPGASATAEQLRAYRTQLADAHENPAWWGTESKPDATLEALDEEIAAKEKSEADAKLADLKAQQAAISEKIAAAS